ncbi:KilA-N domain-containing protein [Pseudomonas marincola]|uniref:KilA-N domain-containing protein n=1 Tax=Pseudomonas marincola TaxID=437900 RepID=UPI0008E4D48A|nr:KilA-N domain-containing protein [Pseudomonas marincola]SFU11539.1 KilA-N domain-containing protein [Pseudomonas marincola]
MSVRIVPFSYEGQAVAFNADGWINATQAAERFGKVPNEWLRLPDTERYLDGMKRRYGEIPYVKTSRARADRGGGTWLHPKLAVKFARWLSVDFEIWCDEQVDGLLRGESKPWSAARHEAAIGHKAVCDALAFNFEIQGKTAKAHHYINESRLINKVITGSFAGRDRDQLSERELEIVTLAELRDTALIGAGLAYAERKANLLCYVRELQSKHQRRVAA